jgi:hypothetical protein
MSISLSAKVHKTYTLLGPAHRSHFPNTQVLMYNLVLDWRVGHGPHTPSKICSFSSSFMIDYLLVQDIEA